MNLLRWSGQWGGVLVAALGLSACGLANDEAQGSLGTSEAALCSVQQTCPGGAPVTCSSATSSCLSSPDNGGWVECDGVRTHCLSAPACTCGTERHTEFVYGEGMTCGVAQRHARSLMVDLVAYTCPAGSCDAVDLNGECTPLGSEYTDGFRISLTHTFSCKAPANCQ